MDSNKIHVIFVCHGNICRSPMAEFVMKELAKSVGLLEKFVITSAAVSTEEIGNDMYPPAKRKLYEKQIPFAYKRARQITREDYLGNDYVIIMDKSNRRWLQYIIGEDSDGKVSQLMEWTGENRDVADPWYTGDFEQAYQDIEKGCRAILEKLIK